MMFSVGISSQTRGYGTRRKSCSLPRFRKLRDDLVSRKSAAVHAGSPRRAAKVSITIHTSVQRWDRLAPRGARGKNKLSTRPNPGAFENEKIAFRANTEGQGKDCQQGNPGFLLSCRSA